VLRANLVASLLGYARAPRFLILDDMARELRPVVMPETIVKRAVLAQARGGGVPHPEGMVRVVVRKKPEPAEGQEPREALQPAVEDLEAGLRVEGVDR